MKKYLILAIIIFTAFFVKNAHAQTQALYKAPIVRVAVIKDVKQLDLYIKSEFKIMPLETDDVLYSQKILDASIVRPMFWGVKIADIDFKVYGIRIFPSEDSAIFINKRPFRGEIDIIRQADQTLLVVNHINVEDYLRGVLYHEVSHWWPMAALEAQAIAARSFALYQADTNRNKDYDLVSTVYSQVYGGANSERSRTNDAVYRTAGKILVYKDEILPAYFHATCAGHTEDASVLWKTDLVPLKGVACNFCKLSPHFFWKKKIPLDDIEKALSLKGIQAITPKQWSNSGRVAMLEIQLEDKKINLSGKDFRQKLGNDIIKSTIFEVKIIPDSQGKLIANIEGAGWGHGVGLCQWGAFGMARRGYSAEKILQFYYPGASIKTYNEQ